MTNDRLEEIHRLNSGLNGGLPRHVSQELIDTVWALKAASNSQIGYSNQARPMTVVGFCYSDSDEPGSESLVLEAEAVGPVPLSLLEGMIGRTVRVSFEEGGSDGRET